VAQTPLRWCSWESLQRRRCLRVRLGAYCPFRKRELLQMLMLFGDEFEFATSYAIRRGVAVACRCELFRAIFMNQKE